MPAARKTTMPGGRGGLQQETCHVLASACVRHENDAGCRAMTGAMRPVSTAARARMRPPGHDLTAGIPRNAQLGSLAHRVGAAVSM